MAEKSCKETRRQSFRRTISDAALPPEYLDGLELKRRQLDESIHKYVAAKEREFKQFERDLRHQCKLAVQDRDSSGRRRTSSESTRDAFESPILTGSPQRGLAESLPEAGQIREKHAESRKGVAHTTPADVVASSSSAAATNHQTSIDGDKDFVGVFTPHFLPALGRDEPAPMDRTSSEPPSILKVDRLSDAGMKRVQRANSDTAAHANPRRPPHLSISSRTSSSGSSVDGKLTSVLKSPTQSNRPTRKRVSLAVGDSIVAPSDSVPEAMSHNSTPSHSRTRSPAREKIASVDEAVALGMDAEDSTVDSEPTEPDPREEVESEAFTATKVDAKAVPLRPFARAEIRERAPPKVDPDGDLFDLEHEDDDDHLREVTASDLDSENELAGRVELDPGPPADAKEYYEPSEGLIPLAKERKEHKERKKAPDTVDFRPGSVNAALQPTHAGFRRPSVTYDPIYKGPDYDRAEHFAVVDDVYGSSYSRPSSKGSFTAGSQGEELMARHMRRELSSEEYPRV